MATLTTIIPNMPKRIQSNDDTDTYAVPIREQTSVTSLEHSILSSLGIAAKIQKYNFLDKQEDITNLTKIKIMQEDQPVLVNITDKEQEPTKKYNNFSALQQNIDVYLQNHTQANNSYDVNSSDYPSNHYVLEKQDNIPNDSLIYGPTLDYYVPPKLDDSDAVHNVQEILTQLHTLTQEVHDLRSDFLRPNHRFHW